MKYMWFIVVFVVFFVDDFLLFLFYYDVYDYIDIWIFCFVLFFIGCVLLDEVIFIFLE